MKKMIDIFTSRPDTFTFLIGSIMFLVAATIAKTPIEGINGGIFGVAFGMLGGLYYTEIKTILIKRASSPPKKKD